MSMEEIKDDGSLASLRLPHPEGRKTFHCQKVTQQQLINREFWVFDYGKDVKTKYGDGKYIVFIKFNKDDKSMKKTIFKKLSRLRHGLIRPDTWRRSFASWHGWLLWRDAFRLENTILNNLKLITT